MTKGADNREKTMASGVESARSQAEPGGVLSKEARGDVVNGCSRRGVVPPNRYMPSKVKRRTLSAEDFLSDLIVTVGND
jgi:hypothetical protein